MTIGVMIPIKEISQRVPDKTFRILGDKPLAFWIVDSLLQTKDYFDIEIWINTDSEKVMDLYQQNGYDLFYYLRPLHLLGHEVSMNRIIDDWMNNCGEFYSYYLQTHITNPFLSIELLVDALSEGEYYAQGSHRSILGVTRHQCRMWHKGQPVNFNLGEVIQTQDLRPVFEDNSCLYVFDKPGFDQWGGRVSPNPQMLEVPWPYNIDIDTEQEWELAEIIARDL